MKDVMNPRFAYKILQAEDYQTFMRRQIFTGSAVDHTDGYIHLSLADQLQDTLAKHYQGKKDLYLIEVDLQAVKADVKFEQSRGGAYFPHLYADLEKIMTRRIWPLNSLQDGAHTLPADLEI